MIDDDYIAEYRQGASTLEYLADKVRKYHMGEWKEPGAASERTRKQKTTPNEAAAAKVKPPPDRFREMLRQHLTAEAAREIFFADDGAKQPKVQEFRARLPDRSLGPWEEGTFDYLIGHTWFRERRDAAYRLHEHEGLPLPALQRELHPDVNADNLGRFPSVVRSRALSLRDEFVELSELCESLANRYRWKLDDVWEFIVWDRVPRVQPRPLIEVEIDRSPAFPVLDRIILNADPAVPPADVERTYREQRAQFMRRAGPALDQKRLQLAVFKVGRPEKETVAQRMAAWNQAFPNWAYHDRANFHSEMKQAQERVCGRRRAPEDDHSRESQ